MTLVTLLFGSYRVYIENELTDTARKDSTMTAMTIDSIAKLEIQRKEHFNEIRTLQTLTQGIHQLYAMVKHRELEFERRCGANNMVMQSFGIDFDGSRDRLDVIACFFHWFGVSLCNYSRLVGFIHGLETKAFTRATLQDRDSFQDIKVAVDSYVRSVTELEKVQVWRNKVSAHFAITDPRKDDNAATLDMSVIFPITFENRYVVGGLTMTVGDSVNSQTSQLPRWSLTEVFEALMPRYWPGCSIPTVENIQAADGSPDRLKSRTTPTNDSDISKRRASN